MTEHVYLVMYRKSEYEDSDHVEAVCLKLDVAQDTVNTIVRKRKIAVFKEHQRNINYVPLMDEFKHFDPEPISPEKPYFDHRFDGDREYQQAHIKKMEEYTKYSLKPFQEVHKEWYQRWLDYFKSAKKSFPEPTEEEIEAQKIYEYYDIEKWKVT